jgi:4-amino-4-deoxy-L-arabinose transferase-like glycosyltransferase
MQQVLARLDGWTRITLDWIAGRCVLAAGFLVVLCLALYLPGFAALPVTDRDEARFAQATKQMLETGDFIDIRFQDEPRYKKPVGIYWLQALSVSALADGKLIEIWAYRIPSLLGIIAAVLLTWWAAGPIFGRRVAFLAAILLAGAFTLSLEARIAKSDAVLLATVVLMQGALARLYLFSRKLPIFETHKRWLQIARFKPADDFSGHTIVQWRLPCANGTGGIAALFWIAMGLGILIKGPVAPALAVLTAIPLLVFDRDRSWLRSLHWMWGLPLMLAITLPWFIAIGIVSDWSFYREALGEDFAAKLQSGQEKHWGPPGFYFVLFWWSFWPAALVATGGAALWLWRNRVRRRTLFLLSWIIPFWLILEATPTKLPHYAMVLYPAAAMGAAWVLREAAMTGALRLRSYKQGALLWTVIAALQLGFLAFLLIYFGTMPAFAFFALAAGVVLFSSMTLVAGWTGRFHAAIVCATLAAALLYAAAFRFVLPVVEPVWISRQVAEAFATLRPCAPGPIVLTRYREPSAVFLIGTDTRMMSTGDANTALSRGTIGLALFRQDDAGKLPLVDPPPRSIACINGFSINGGSHLRLQLITAKPEADFAACQVPERFRCGR